MTRNSKMKIGVMIMKKMWVGLILLLVPLVVNAKSAYWQDYFENLDGDGILDNYGTWCGGSYQYGGYTQWQDIKRGYLLEMGGCGDMSMPNLFYPTYFTKGNIYHDVVNGKVKSSDESILTGELKPYDYAEEKKNFEEYVKDFNALTYEEFIAPLKQDFEEEAAKYPTKPTWWEYNGYETEPKTWWEAYGFTSEPQNAVVVTSHAHDIGNAYLTVSADNKNDIKITWEMKAVDDVEPDGITDILNDLDRYQSVMDEEEECQYGIGDAICKPYNFRISSSSEDQDLSKLIKALKGKDITVLFVNYSGAISSSYFLNGKDITEEVEEGFNYNHNISMETSIEKENIEQLVEAEDKIFIDFAYHGSLPAPYTVSIDLSGYILNSFYKKYEPEYQCDKYPDEEDAHWECMDKLNEVVYTKLNDYFKNTKLTLLYYNPETKQMEVIKKDILASESGIVELTFDHFSSYVLVGDYQLLDAPKASENIPSVPKTSDNIGYVMSTLFIGLSGILLAVKMKKCKE